MLQKQADAVELCGDDAMPCQMLKIIDSQATCRIEFAYGKDAKPDVCKNYPEEGPCFYEQQFNEGAKT